MAAAVTVVSRRHNMDRQDSAATDEAMDEDHDGKISVKELMRGLHKVAVRADHMVEVLELERGLMEMSTKLPNFCLCLICFILALIEFSPPGSVPNVHRRLFTHYGLDQLANVKDFHSIYQYMEAFEKKNEMMQATSFKYWCEKRYAVHKWDEHLMAPSHSCPSPRYVALDLVSNKAYRWQYVNTSGGAGSTPAPAPAAAAGSSAGSRSVPLNSPPPCVDNEAELRRVSGNAAATCLAWALDTSHHVCEDEHGLTLCPKTCGFCSPFVYDKVKRFERPQVTMIPVMVYQTRFVKSACHGFAETYDTQPFNPVLKTLPALDGRRTAEVLTCIDRTKHQESAYAIELPCSNDTPPVYCHNGKFRITEKHTFHGDVVYPKLLIEPHRDIMKMEEVEWIDLQSEVVSLSTLVYTEGVEVFTSLTVDFAMDEAGNVDGSYKMISYRDMLGSHKALFIACLIVTCVGALVGVGLSAWTVYRHRQDPNAGELCRGQVGYEFFSRSLLLIYPLVLLFSWTAQVPMSQEFDHLLHSFLDLPGITEADIEHGVQAYFDVKTHIYGETKWLTQHRIVAYIVCYVQFLQLVLYFNAHPKMAVLTLTVHKAMDNICHFLLLFGTLFIMLGFMSHWMLGPYIPSYGTLGDAFRSQVQMLYGEFIQADRVEDLQGSMTVMYWLYAGTFMLLVIWTLLNFFLAIIVDAFVEVKESNASNVAARDFFTDTAGVFWTKIVAMRSRWPRREALIAFFKEQVEVARSEAKGEGATEDVESYPDLGEKKEVLPLVGCDVLMDSFDASFHNKEALATFILHYHSKCASVLTVRPDYVPTPSRRSTISAVSQSGLSGQAEEEPPSGAQQEEAGEEHGGPQAVE